MQTAIAAGQTKAVIYEMWNSSHLGPAHDMSHLSAKTYCSHYITHRETVITSYMSPKLDTLCADGVVSQIFISVNDGSFSVIK